MHGFPYGSRFDVILEKGFPECIWIAIAILFRKLNTAEPMVTEKIRARFLKNLYVRDIPKNTLIKVVHSSAQCHVVVQHLHLAPPYSSRNIAQSIIVSNMAMLIMGCLIPGLGGKKNGLGN